jgi:hypothetical protein
MQAPTGNYSVNTHAPPHPYVDAASSGAAATGAAAAAASHGTPLAPQSRTWSRRRSIVHEAMLEPSPLSSPSHGQALPLPLPLFALSSLATTHAAGEQRGALSGTCYLGSISLLFIRQVKVRATFCPLFAYNHPPTPQLSSVGP